jgi:hypothetical protein
MTLFALLVKTSSLVKTQTKLKFGLVKIFCSCNTKKKKKKIKLMKKEVK